MQSAEPEYGDLGTVPVNQLRTGDFLVVVGREYQGKFVARRIVVALRSEAEEKKRGSLFRARELELVEDQDYPELDAKAIGYATFNLASGKALVAPAAVLVKDGELTSLLTTASTFKKENPQKIWLSAKESSAEIAKVLGTTKEVLGLETHSEQSKLEALLPLKTSQKIPFAGGEVVAVGIKNAPAALPLASQIPKRGDIVYLQGWYDGPTWWCEAIVAYADANRLFLHISSEGEEERVPGSLIVNRQKEVVGLHVGGTDPYISAVSVEALRQALRESHALNKKP